MKRLKVEDPLDALAEQYPAALAQLDDEFSFAAFIRMLSWLNQRLYIELLHEHRGAQNPFQTVHRRISLRLRDYARKTNKTKKTRDIFWQEQEYPIWHKR